MFLLLLKFTGQQNHGPQAPIPEGLNSLKTLNFTAVNKYMRMKNGIKFGILFGSIALLSSCLKEFSEEGGNTSGSDIIGADCRISKINYTDSSGIVSSGALAATINVSDLVTDITKFDSLTATIDFNSIPAYSPLKDTVYIDPYQYFILTGTTRLVTHLHSLVNPSDPFSPKLETDYAYDAAGYLLSKTTSASVLPGFPLYNVMYTYSAGNPVKMVYNDLFAGNKLSDALMDYYVIVKPHNFIYVFPDEDTYSPFTQFLNFGTKPVNALKSVLLKNYDPGNVLRDSAVTNFTTYILSRDSYVLSVQVSGNNQPGIPAETGMMKFSYICK